MALVARDIDMLVRVRAGAARPRRRDRARAAAGAVHARPPEPGAPLPVADGLDARHDRRPRAGARGPGAEVVERVGAVAATSANLHGGPDPEARRGARARSARRGGVSTAASCRAPRRRCSTSPATSRRCCARERCRPPRRSSGLCASERRAHRGRYDPRRRHGRRAGDARSTCGPRGSPRSIPRSPSCSGASSSAQRGQIELIASENFTWPSRARGRRLGADEQVRRGLSRQALLRRLRGRRRDRADSRSTARRSSSAPSTRTSSRTRAPRRTWPSTWPRSSRATRSSRSSSRTAAT